MTSAGAGAGGRTPPPVGRTRAPRRRGTTSPAPVDAAEAAARHVGRWVPVCRYEDLAPDRGAAALVSGRQVALFRTAGDGLYALVNRDPYSGGNVLARGAVGRSGTVPTVASVSRGHLFDLRTGRCLDDEAVAVRVVPVRRTADGVVEVGVP